MAQLTTAPARRRACAARARIGLLPAASLLGASLTLAACSAVPFATVEAPEEPPLGAAEPLYDASYTSIVPRAFLDFEDLDENAPNHYVVVEGDTLWDISDRFLKKPWLWSKLWNYNPSIANPHLIYPGDELKLEYINNRPSLVLSRNGEALPTAAQSGGQSFGPNGEPLLGAATPGVERLSPRIRAESLEEAIPMISADDIGSFLNQPRVVMRGDVKDAPYVLASEDDRLISALGHEVFARGDIDPSITEYSVFRSGSQFRDPKTGEFLGKELIHVADARLLSVGDPSTLIITSNEVETRAGDILLPKDGSGLAASYTPRLPEIRGDGRVVSLVDSMVQSGRDQIIVLNLGERSGVKEGDVLAIESRGITLIDERGKHSHESVEAPAKRTGVVMVFQTFDKVSYGLIMQSDRPIRVNDYITGI